MIESENRVFMNSNVTDDLDWRMMMVMVKVILRENFNVIILLQSKFMDIEDELKVVGQNQQTLEVKYNLERVEREAEDGLMVDDNINNDHDDNATFR